VREENWHDGVEVRLSRYLQSEATRLQESPTRLLNHSESQDLPLEKVVSVSIADEICYLQMLLKNKT
jgi:hypothetical protein